MLKKCSTCKKNKPLDNFYISRFYGGHQSSCKECDKKHAPKYYKTKEGRESWNKASKKSYIIHKEKWIARAKARYAISRGIIIKPKKCEVCEKVKPLQGHHEDYSKPLEVIFLCSSCHVEADKLLKL